MKRLIINADDLGADEGRNEGIFEAIRAGVVTSASILPNGPALDMHCRGIRAGRFEKVSFGVHLNLTEGRPLSHDAWNVSPAPTAISSARRLRTGCS